MENSVFEKLNAINVNEHTDVKDNGKTKLTYLSWAWAYAELMKIYPDTTYEIVHWDGKPYLFDENLGYMVETRMTINGQTKEMWLPVMDGSNKAMKNVPYNYKVKEYKFGKATGNFIDKTVEAATMFDINTTIMRCLVKNIGVFGLGLYIYAGEDLPESEQEKEEPKQETNQESKKESKQQIPNEIKLAMDEFRKYCEFNNLNANEEWKKAGLTLKSSDIEIKSAITSISERIHRK